RVYKANVTNNVSICEFIDIELPVRSKTLIGVFNFFFHAEDGIRSFHVTGVQTCALPISSGSCLEVLQKLARGEGLVAETARAVRSEERRVGKECRTRWSPCHSNIKSYVAVSSSSVQKSGTTWKLIPCYHSYRGTPICVNV